MTQSFHKIERERPELDNTSMRQLLTSISSKTMLFTGHDVDMIFIGTDMNSI
jgi:hypothetical protein